MSTEESAPLDGQLHSAANTEPSENAQKPAVKRSWRRKYRKMRARFEDNMNTSSTLIKDEFKASAVARRLQEQNDQILDLLLDINESGRLPAHLRFDLRELSGGGSALPSLEAERDPEAMQRRLHELRVDMTNGVITEEEFAHKADQLHTSPVAVPNRTLTSLEARVPHTTQVPDPAPEGVLLGEHAPGYMSPTHEEEYLLATDVALADPLYDPNAHDGRPLRVPPTRPVPTEKDLTIQNPDSVYNWLRKHQPQVFLQDKDPSHPENTSEKSTARTGNGPGRGKRPSAVSATTPVPKGEQDGDEDAGFIPESGTGAKGRRGNKDDDSAYRPKGGGNRPGKRKREDGDPVGKGGRKKNRTSGATTISS